MYYKQVTHIYVTYHISKQHFPNPNSISLHPAFPQEYSDLNPVYGLCPVGSFLGPPIAPGVPLPNLGVPVAELANVFIYVVASGGLSPFVVFLFNIPVCNAGPVDTTFPPPPIIAFPLIVP